MIQVLAMKSVLLLFLSATLALAANPFPNLKTVVVEIFPAPGRGNVGAAVETVYQLRAAGCKGDIILVVPENEHVQKALALMQEDYKPKGPELQIVGSGTNSFKILTSPFIEHVSKYAPQGVDLHIQPGYGGVRGPLESKVHVSIDLLSHSPKDKIQIDFNRKEYKIRSVLGFEGLGFYGDHVIQEAMAALYRSPDGFSRLEKATVQMLKNAADQQKAPHYAKLADWLSTNSLANQAFGVAYGVGLDETQRGFILYLKALREQMLTKRESAVVLSVSQLNPEELQYIGGKTFARVIDLQRAPESLSGLPKPGEVWLVHGGAVPQKIYGNLLALSSLPPIVAGDMGLGTAMALGRPFVMTRGFLNRGAHARLIKLLQKEAKTSTSASSALEAIGGDKMSFDWNRLVSDSAKKEFAAISDRFSTPIPVQLAHLADEAIENPIRADIKLKKLSKMKVAEKTSGECPDLLLSR
jgi:hypothetical protein